jgi:hypothetical protein
VSTATLLITIRGQFARCFGHSFNPHYRQGDSLLCEHTSLDPALEIITILTKFRKVNSRFGEVTSQYCARRCVSLIKFKQDPF